MCDSRKRDAAVEHKLIAFFAEHVVEHRPRLHLVPSLAEQRAAVGQRFLHVRVSRQDRIADEIYVGRDALLEQEHEQLAETRQPRAGVADQPPAYLRRRMRQVGLAHHHEHTLARRLLQLVEKGHGVGDPIEHVAADDQVRGRDLGVLPGARDDRHVVAWRDVRTHAIGRFDRACSHVDQCLTRR